MEKKVVYSTENGHSLDKQKSTFETNVKTYINLINKQRRLEREMEETKRQIKDLDWELNKCLSDTMGRMVTIDGCHYCCLATENGPAIIPMF